MRWQRDLPVPAPSIGVGQIRIPLILVKVQGDASAKVLPGEGDRP
jgi:hypothetical protein